MSGKSLRLYNLNTLPVLREILRQKSVTKAAAALNMTQPALSNILRQLRIDLDDEIVVRHGREMRLTPKAEALINPLEVALASLNTIFTGQDFDPATASDVFRIASTDHVLQMIGRPLMTKLAKDAPHMCAHLLQVIPASVGELMRGEIDMVITPRILLGAGLTSPADLNDVVIEPLYTENLVVVGRNDDEALAAGLSQEAYLQRPHASYIIDTKRLATVEQVALSQLGVEQQQRLMTMHYTLLPMIAAETGELAVVPERLAQLAMRYLPIQAVAPPIPLPPMEWMTVVHKRNANRPLIAWLKNLLLDITGKPEKQG